MQPTEEHSGNHIDERPFIGCKMITVFTYRKRNVFLTDEVNSILCRAMTHHVETGNVIITGFVIMPNHVHMLLRPGSLTISEFIGNFKTYTGQKIKTARDFSRKVWRRRYYDTDINDYDTFVKRLEKLHNNPVKKGIVERPEDYRWSSCSSYIGRPGLVPVLTDDYTPPSFTIF